MDALFTVAGKLVTLFIYVIAGYIVCRKKAVSEAFCDGISRFLTPINAAIVVGMVLFIARWRLPGPVDHAVSGLSSLTTPLAMFYVGTILTRSSIRDVLGDWRTYACSFMRLIAVPLLVIGHAMPVAGFCAIFAGEYGNDVVLASKFIFITTLLCIITIPVFAFLL